MSPLQKCLHKVLKTVLTMHYKLFAHKTVLKMHTLITLRPTSQIPTISASPWPQSCGPAVTMYKEVQQLSPIKNVWVGQAPVIYKPSNQWPYSIKVKA